jgi:large subunit ribosomal protein L16
MQFIPIKFKHKKLQKGKSFNKIKGKALLKQGQIGLKALVACRLTSNQLITLYGILKKKMKKKGRVFLRIFPQSPVTTKPIEVRMGKGKGNVSFWAAKISPGTIICEISTPFLYLASKILYKISSKISVKTKIFIRRI